MVKTMVCAAALLVACGGGKKAATTTTDEAHSPAGPATDHVDDGMVPPEKMEEINRMLERKQRIMSRCLADAVDSKELPKNSRGRITLEIVIAPSGEPTTVKVINATIESETLSACVIGHVKSIRFPELPKAYPTSYTYGFEAM